MAKTIVLFDGVCILCNSLVRILIKVDFRRVLYFATLQSRFAKQTIERIGVGQPPQNTVVLVYNERLFVKSDAILEISKILGFPCSLAYLGKLLPRVFRDGLYEWIATNRIHWFGVKQGCFVPSPEHKARFLDLDPI